MRAARACEVSFPERVTTGEADETKADDRPKHQLVAEKTDEVWQQAKPFVCDAFALSRGQNLQIHENAFWEQHTYMGCARTCTLEAVRPHSLSTRRESASRRDRPTAIRSVSSRSRRFGRSFGTLHEICPACEYMLHVEQPVETDARELAKEQPK